MTGSEIKELITFNNKQIEELYDPTTFVLNRKVMKYIEDNERLKAICPHQFENGKCVFCETQEN